MNIILSNSSEAIQHTCSHNYGIGILIITKDTKLAKHCNAGSNTREVICTRLTNHGLRIHDEITYHFNILYVIIFIYLY